MSNLSDAIEHLEDAEQLLNTEAEIGEFNTPRSGKLSEMADRIRHCKDDLEELEEEG